MINETLFQGKTRTDNFVIRNDKGALSHSGSVKGGRGFEY
jgi:hypothetical protein